MKQLWDGTDKCDFKNGVMYSYHSEPHPSGNMVYHMPLRCLEFAEYVTEHRNDYKSEPVVIYVTTELTVEEAKVRFYNHGYEDGTMKMRKDVFDIVRVLCTTRNNIMCDIDGIIKGAKEKGKNVVGIFVDEITDIHEASLAKISLEEDIPVVIGRHKRRTYNEIVKVPLSCVNNDRLLYTHKNAYDVCTESM